MKDFFFNEAEYSTIPFRSPLVENRIIHNEKNVSALFINKNNML